MIDYEQLGAFYLGKSYDMQAAEVEGGPILYDSKDLTTHGVIVGMTGSGKTGLGVTLLEEAAIDGIPALVIDPKGDMGNLLMQFPALQPEDFLPWVEREEAARRGQTPEEFAADRAELWKNGLAQWDQDPDRIGRLQERVRKAEQRVEAEREQARSAKTSAAVSFGQSILGALFGRKVRSTANATRAGSAIRSASRASQQTGDIKRAEDNVREREAERAELEQELEEQTQEIREAYQSENLQLEPCEIKPRKVDVSVDTCGLLWLPLRIDGDGIAEPAWEQSE